MAGIELNMGLMLFLLVGLAAALPWLGLLILNWLNGNIMAEIKATIDRKCVKVVRVLQNNRIQTMYRKMSPKDNSILIKKTKKDSGEQDEVLIPDIEPHIDDASNRPVYLTVAGNEGNINLLRETNREINSPQKQMGFSLAFEAGRKYERYLKPMLTPTLLSYILFIGVIAVVGLALIFLWNNTSLLTAIAQHLGVPTG